MDIVWMLAMAACLGLVLYWYIANEIAGDDGEQGVLALRPDTLDEAASKEGGRYYIKRVRVRDQMKRRDARPPDRTADDAHRVRNEGKAFRDRAGAPGEPASKTRYRTVTPALCGPQACDDPGADAD